MPPKLYPRLLLAVLTGLNILNYIDRNVLFAVHLTKKEFLVSDTKIGVLQLRARFFISARHVPPDSDFLQRRLPLLLLRRLLKPAEPAPLAVFASTQATGFPET